MVHPTNYLTNEQRRLLTLETQTIEEQTKVDPRTGKIVDITLSYVPI